MNVTDTINYTKDIDFEYNTKLILLFLLAIYAIFGLWWVHRLEIKYLHQYYLQHFIYLICCCYIAVLPLWIFFLSRNVPIDVILKPMIVVYSSAGLLGIISLFIFGGEKIKLFFTGEGFYRNRK